VVRLQCIELLVRFHMPCTDDLTPPWSTLHWSVLLRTCWSDWYELKVS